jgi:hypothetical protein
MPTLTTPSTVTFSLQVDQILTLTSNFGAGRVVLSAQRGGDVVFDYTSDQFQNTPVFSSGSQGLVTITHLSGSLTYNVTSSTFGLDATEVASTRVLLPRVMPYILAQTAIPFILAGGTSTNQFTITATGALSNLPTLPITSGNAFIYLPASVTGLPAAGWYYSSILSATTAQISTSRYTSGDPLLAIPAVFTNPAGITAGNYSQTTGSDITGLQFTIPGGSLGPNGGLDIGAFVRISDSANSKNMSINLAGTVLWQNNTNVAGNVTSQSLTRTRNRNSQSSQVNSGSYNGGITNFWNTSGTIPVYTTVNTATDAVLSIRHNMAVATDFVVVEMFDVQLRYGA